MEVKVASGEANFVTSRLLQTKTTDTSLTLPDHCVFVTLVLVAVVHEATLPYLRILAELEENCEQDPQHREIEKAISCLAAILRLEEEKYVATEPGLTGFLALLESGKDGKELRQALKGVNFLEQVAEEK